MGHSLRYNLSAVQLQQQNSNSHDSRLFNKFLFCAIFMSQFKYCNNIFIIYFGTCRNRTISFICIIICSNHVYCLSWKLSVTPDNAFVLWYTLAWISDPYKYDFLLVFYFLLCPKLVYYASSKLIISIFKHSRLSYLQAFV